jgi:PAS domain S-box-containing protein
MGSVFTLRTLRISLAPRVALSYLLFGGLWIGFSDHILLHMVSDPQRLTQFQTYKGLGFVVFSALLIYLLVLQGIRPRERAEQKYQSIFEHAPQGIYQSTPQGQYLSLNPAMARIYGYKTPDEMLTSVTDVDQALFLSRKARQKFTRQLARRGHVENFEAIQKRKDGSLIWTLNHARLVSNDKGEVQHCVGFVTDITARKQAEEMLEQKAKQLEALYETTLDLTKSHELPRLLETIVERAAHLLNSSGGGMYLCEPQQEQVRCVVSYNTPEDYTGTMLKYGEGAAGFVAQTRQPLIIDDYRQWGERAAVFEENQPFVSILSVPMIWQGEVRGVIHVLRNDEENKFTETDQSLLSQFANQATIAVENARLLKDAQERLSELITIYKASQRIQQLKTPQELAIEVVSLIKQIVGFDYCAILSVDESGLKMNPFIISEAGSKPMIVTPKEPQFNSLEAAIGSGIIGWVAQKGQSARLGDVSKSRRYRHMYSDVRSELCVPLQVGDLVIGVINVEDRHPDAYAESHQRILETIATQVAVAIQNARLLEELQIHAAELEKRVEERTSELRERVEQVEELNHALSNLLTDLQATNRRLETASKNLQAANTELETFAYTVSHDLKAPLRGIDGYSRLLMESYADQLDQEGRQFLQTIRDATDQMAELIDDLLIYSRVERLSMAPGPVQIQELVKTLLSERAEEAKERGVKVISHIKKGLSITADPEGLSLIMRNLIDNALKFTAKVSEATIEIVGRKAEKGCILEVHDNGIGFDMKFHDRIFDIFQRLHRAEEYPGTGVGLAIARRAAQRMGGRIWAESEPGKGSTFFLELPH